MRWCRSRSSAPKGCGLAAIPPETIFVVGDTPHDVACARAVGAVPVAVATGTFSVDQLRASGAEIVFDDLSDTERRFRLRCAAMRSVTAEPAD